MTLALLNRSAVLIAEGDDAAAHTCLGEALQTYRALDERWFIAQTLLYLGKVVWRAGDQAQAIADWEESIVLAREVGANRHLAEALFMSGFAAQESYDLPRARALYRESLTLYRTTENSIGAAYALCGLASLSESPVQQAQLLGAAAVVLDTARLPMDQIERAHYEHMVAAARTELGEAAFAAAWTEGQATSLEQAVALASA